MIINDENKFIFIHIPKCAGTTIRLQLSKFADHDNLFSKVVEHDELGPLDMAHIPLTIMSQFYPQVFQKVTSYDSFAILRNPFERFPSSLFQSIRMYGDVNVSSMSPRALVDEAKRVIEVLEGFKESDLLPYNHIHFQPQISYIEIAGKRIVNYLYTIENLQDFYHSTNSKFSTNIFNSAVDQKISGASRIHKFKLLESALNATPSKYRHAILSALPGGVLKLGRQMFLANKELRIKEVLGDSEVSSFISRFYSKDIAMYQQLKSRGTFKNVIDLDL